MTMEVCKCEVFEGTGSRLKEEINKWLEEHQPDILIDCITQSGYTKNNNLMEAVGVTTICIWYQFVWDEKR